MTTSQVVVRETIEEYLNGLDYRVIALKGAWGTGKTHIWGEIEEKWIADEARDLPAYCSLYGLESIESVKMNLFEYVLDSKSSALKTGTKAVSAILESAGKFAERFVPGAAAGASVAKGLGGLVADSVISKTLQSRTVVLDDLERRGDKLSVTAVLGFIDYLKKQDCHVLVIFNEEKLAETDKENTLSRFREKALDIEVTVAITAAEAFEIATKDRTKDVPYVNEFREAFERTGVDNIRIAKRVASIADKIFSGNRQLDNDLVNIAVDATVVLTALYYEGFEDAPKFNDVLEACGPLNLNMVTGDVSPKDLATRKFINDHPFPKDDEFLKLLASHLETGHSLGSEFSKFWIGAKSRRMQIADRAGLTDWLSKSRWDHQSSETELRARAKELFRSADLLHFAESALFAQELTRLGDQSLAKSYIDNAVKRLDSHGTEDDVTYATALLDEKLILPTQIEDAIERLRQRTDVVPTLLDVLLRSKEGAHLRFARILEAASADDYARALLDAPYNSLFDLIKLYVSFIAQKDGHVELPPFSSVVEAALRKILDDPSNVRMVEIVTRTLLDFGVEAAKIGKDSSESCIQENK